MKSDNKVPCDDAPTLIDGESQGPVVTRGSRLQAGGRFVIKEKNSDRILTISKGFAMFQKCDDIESLDKYWHWHWDCIDDQGWFRLQNRVTGGFIGVCANGRRGLIIKVKNEHRLSSSGRLVVTLTSNGDQTLSVVSPTDELEQMTLGSFSNILVPRKSGGVGLEFIKLEDWMVLGGETWNFKTGWGWALSGRLKRRDTTETKEN
ncbi:hypothetical protein E4U54_002218 [Claviceps lovelessii]|nr:hypothetical protein E4U54_002218 [Claviceps lovelessii]